MFVWSKRGFLSLAILGLSFTGVAQAQAPDRVNVLIGFDRTPGAADEALVRGHGGAVKYRYHLVPAIAASIPEKAMAALLRSPRVTRVELDGQVHAIDAEMDESWGIGRIGTAAVHADSNFGSGVSVAVIDSGIDYNHPELSGSYEDGWDFVNDDNNPMDDNDHGTHVSGTVAAADNDLGVVGVAPGVSLYGLKVLSASGSGSWSDIIAALQWVVDYNAGNGGDPDIRITNNSYGSSRNPGVSVELAFINSFNAGVLHIAAAGNAGNCGGKGDKVGYPARYDSVVAVAATNSSDGSPCFSSTGPDLELAAPGVSIKSTVPGGGYATWNGTSMASPHVAGAAALIAASDGTLSNVQIRQRLVDTAIDLGPTGHDNYYGHGLIDVAAAVAVDSGFDDTLPWVVMTDPTAGDVISGATNNVAANAGDDLSVAQVEFFVDNFGIGTDTIDDGSGSWSVNWNASEACNGEHIVSATAKDSIGQLGPSLESVAVTVTNDPDFCAEPEPEPDMTPPNPATMTWANAPVATGTSSIAMTATTATDDSGPVEYLFICVSGNANCSDSNWQTSTSYEVFDLTAGSTYSFKVQARDSASTPNVTDWSAEASATTNPLGTATTMHVAALVGVGLSGRRPGKWDAQVTITVRDDNGALVNGAAVSGTWSNDAKGGASCTTTDGVCIVTKSNLKSGVMIVTLTVKDVAGTLTYDDADPNHVGSVNVTQP